MAEKHAYRLIHVPEGAPFELRESEGRGWGAFATRKIQRGELVLQEWPFFFIPKPHEEITDEDVKKEYDKLSSEQQGQIRLLRDNSVGIFESRLEAFAENCFVVRGEDGTEGYGLFPVHSRLNHSCLPNCEVPTTKRSWISSYALESIEQGAELFFSYIPYSEALTKFERHQALGFHCDCKACLPESSFGQCSDMRRRLIRGLLYLIHGKDIDGKIRDADSPLITLMDLKKAAENFELSISSRFIYTQGIIALLDREGLLNGFRLQRVKPIPKTLAGYLRKPSNISIAKWAMSQDTLSMRFVVAFWLYERPDFADHAMCRFIKEVVNDRNARRNARRKTEGKTEGKTF